jgi:hypothetical protein
MRNGIPDAVGITFSQMLENHGNVVLIAGLDTRTGKSRFFVFRAYNRGPENMTGLELLAEMLPVSTGRAHEVMKETRPHPESGLPEDSWAFDIDVPDVFKE